jgi:hypothetical protein
MGWENCHLYEFRTRGDRWGLVDPDFVELDVISAKEATLAELLKRSGAKTFKYVYDFGDGWEHTVKVEALDQPATGAGYPRLLEARRRCPPEDVGGPWGYARYLKALADPDHERHDEFVEWRGPGFDPALVDEATIRKAFDRLAKKASPRASKAAAKRRH